MYTLHALLCANACVLVMLKRMLHMICVCICLYTYCLFPPPPGKDILSPTPFSCPTLLSSTGLPLLAGLSLSLSLSLSPSLTLSLSLSLSLDQRRRRSECYKSPNPWVRDRFSGPQTRRNRAPSLEAYALASLNLLGDKLR